MKIGFSPYNSKTNKYIEITIDCIRNSGIEVYDYDKLKHDKKQLKTLDVVNLNWYENTIISRNKIYEIIKMILRTKDLLYLKLNGIKIIYTMHNKIPHDVNNTFLIKMFIRIICKLSDNIVIMSGGTKDVLLDYIKQEELTEKVSYVPHPNYIGAYKDTYFDHRLKWNIQEDELVLLFIGNIKPYKNIENLIEVAKSLKNKPIKFIIAGAPVNNAYKEKIMELISSEDNIIPLIKFIDDDQISSLIKCCDLMVFPYDIKSSLNSGSIILSFSYGKSIISPLISTLKDFDEELFFSYSYNTDEEHKQQLKHQIETAYKIYIEDPNRITQMGNKLKEIVAIKNSKEFITDNYFALYNDLLK